MSYTVHSNVQDSPNGKTSHIKIELNKNKSTLTSENTGVAHKSMTLPVIEQTLITELSKILQQLKSQESITLEINLNDVDEADLNLDEITKVLESSVNLTQVNIICAKPAVQASADKSDRTQNTAPELSASQIKPAQESQLKIELIKRSEVKAVNQKFLTIAEQIQLKANEITARNKLINLLGVRTQGENFKPWEEIMAAYLDHAMCTVDHYGVSTISYYGNSAGSGIPTQLEIEIAKTVRESGKAGFRAFLRAAFAATAAQKNVVYRKKLLFFTPEDA